MGRKRTVSATDAEAGGEAPPGITAPATTTEEEAAPAPAKQPAKRGRKSTKEPVPERVVWHHGLRPPREEGECVRVLSWNVAGLRALLTKRPTALATLAEAEQADVICLQEHKLQDKHVEDVSAQLQLPGWWTSFSCATTTKGRSGVAVLSRCEPLSQREGLGLEEHEGEGRVIAVEYDDYWLVNVYVPNSGEGLKRIDYRTQRWDGAFAQHCKELEKSKPVIITGDLNCAHQEIDIHSPKTNLRSAGFTQEERDSFSKHLIGGGFVDTFRAQYPDVAAYTYWSYRFNARKNNKGWRLDYFLVSEPLTVRVAECYHLPEVEGSDHCPLGLVLRKQ